MTKKILYIEDNPANTLLMRKIISRLPQYQLHDAPNAEAGLDMMDSIRPDIVLMDIGLPGMDGIQAAKEIKARFDFAQNTPIIAVTANAMATHIEGASEAEFFDYITKPIDFSKLITAIELASENI